MADSDDRLPDRTLSLVRAAQQGDARALEDLFSRYLPRVRQIVALRLGRKLRQMVEIDDVVQDVLLDVFRSLDQFEPRSEGSFHNWLARCVEREIVDQARIRERRTQGGKVRRFADFDPAALHTSIIPGEVATPSEYARANELAERIESTLLDLPPHQRELIVLRAVCGMSYAEIAQELGIGELGTVRVAYSRALKKLKSLAGI